MADNNDAGWDADDVEPLNAEQQRFASICEGPWPKAIAAAMGRAARLCLDSTYENDGDMHRWIEEPPYGVDPHVIYLMREGERFRIGICDDPGRYLITLRGPTKREIKLVDQWWFSTRADARLVEEHAHEVMKEWRTPSGWYQFPMPQDDDDFAIEELNELLHW